jgi:hypothetical protein
MTEMFRETKKEKRAALAAARSLELPGLRIAGTTWATAAAAEDGATAFVSVVAGIRTACRTWIREARQGYCFAVWSRIANSRCWIGAVTQVASSASQVVI